MSTTNIQPPNTLTSTYPTNFNTPAFSQKRIFSTSKKLPQELKTAQTAEQLERIENFRMSVFSEDYPEIGNFRKDRHDPYSIILFTENSDEQITSTARIIFDNKEGFPADDYVKDTIDQYRQQGLSLAEVGRFAISDEARTAGLLPIYYRAFYELATENNIDSMIIVINKRSVNFHKKRIGASVILDHIDNIAGSKFQFVCMNWKVKETKATFLKWAGCSTQPLNESYPLQQWNAYSRCFASVMTHVQRELYRDAATYLHGHVIDLGAGVARLAPLLADNPEISGYTAVEQASDMVEIAKFTLQKVGKYSGSLCVSGS